MIDERTRIHLLLYFFSNISPVEIELLKVTCPLSVIISVATFAEESKLLNDEKYGTVFSVDYDGLVTNGDKKSIDDYAVIIGEKIDYIQKITKMNEVILLLGKTGKFFTFCLSLL